MATASELIAERRNAVSKDWQSFRSNKHISIAQVVRRRNAKLPPDFVPWAPAIAIASEYLLRAAGHTSTSGRPKGWHLRPSSGIYRREWHSVRKRGQYWTVEEDLNQYVLVFVFGSMPICTQTFEAAMWLAEYFGDDPPMGHGLCWVRSTPDGILDF